MREGRASQVSILPSKAASSAVSAASSRFKASSFRRCSSCKIDAKEHVVRRAPRGAVGGAAVARSVSLISIEAS